MKVNFVAASVSRISMGVFEVSRQLGINLLNEGCEINVFGLKDEFSMVDRSLWDPIHPKIFEPVRPISLGYSKKYLEVLLDTPADLAHLHVIWMYQSAMIYKWHKKFNKPFITTVNGMLDPWAVKNSKIKKRIAYYLYEKAALNACSCFHVNTIMEYNSLREFGLKNPIAIVNNGVTIPDLTIKYNKPPWEGLVRENKKILLYLSRVHPKKGLVNLIEAIALLKQKKLSELENWVTVVVGCSEGGEHEKELNELVKKYRLEKDILFFGQFFNDDMKACYYHADSYILPSYSEGVPMAALTAWAFGKYSLLTPECNLADGFTAGIAEKIETNPDSIAQGLINVFSMSPEELKRLGQKAYEFVSSEYSWKEMARKMAEVYKWVKNGGAVPVSFIDTN
jgi:poly(glycerol-phosphate) alpha-glucosyltransferase